MSYFGKIGFQDSAALDAFARLRTSGPVTLFDNSQQYGDNALIWENLAAGGASAANDLPGSSVHLTTGGTGSTASIIRQSKKTFHYFPGKSQFATMTVVFGSSVTNNTRRAGYFNASDGIYFEYANGTMNIVLRSSVSGSLVETRVAQSSWNIDKFDGTGPSGVTLVPANIQILVIDLQWLGAGRVRTGFNVGGVTYYAHQFLNANVISNVYMSSGNQPIRFENFNTGTANGTAVMEQMCCSVVYEGQNEPLHGQQFSANTGATTPLVGTSLIPIFSLQASSTGPNSVQNKGIITFQSLNLLFSNDAYMWQLLLNATLTGASFNPVNSTYSIANYDTAATAVSGGLLVDGGFAAGGSNASSQVVVITESLATELALVYSGLLNHQDTLTIACQGLNAGGSVSAGMTWLELGVI